MWLRETFCREGESPSEDPCLEKKTQPCIACSHLLPLLSLLVRDWQKPERVELRGVEFQVWMHVQQVSDLQSGWEATPEFNQRWKIFQNKRTNFYNTFTRCHGEVDARPTPSLFRSARTHCSTGGVTYGIWCVWIRFCSWLQQWDDSSNEWFFTSVLRRQTVEPTWLSSVQRKERTNKQGDA